MKKFLSIFFESTNSFEGKENGEDVILLLRRHVFIIYTHLGFIALPIIIPIILGALFFSSLQTYNLVTLFLFVSCIFYVILWFMAFYVLTMYTLDVWIITNKRIIDSNQEGLFNRIVSELYFSRVQDISVKTNGVVQTMLKFGNVEVQTAGKENKFIFLQIPNPDKVKEIIMSKVELDNSNSPEITNS